MGDVVAGSVDGVERKDIDRVDSALTRLDRGNTSPNLPAYAPELTVLPRASIPVVSWMRRMRFCGRQCR